MTGSVVWKWKAIFNVPPISNEKRIFKILELGVSLFIKISKQKNRPKKRGKIRFSSKKGVKIAFFYYNFKKRDCRSIRHVWQNRHNIKWPYLRLHTTHALEFWSSNRYCHYILPYQKSSKWVVCRRRNGHFIFWRFCHTWRILPGLKKETLALYEIFVDGMITTKELGGVLRSIGQNPTDLELQDIVNQGQVICMLYMLSYVWDIIHKLVIWHSCKKVKFFKVILWKILKIWRYFLKNRRTVQFSRSLRIFQWLLCILICFLIFISENFSIS